MLRILSKIGINITAILLGFVYFGGQIANANAAAINAFLNIETTRMEQVEDGEYVDSEYFKTDYWSIDELREVGTDLNRLVMEEGAVLLKNDNDALPLSSGDKVSLFSSSSVNSVITGTGSGGINVEAINNAVSLNDGLTQAGLEVNQQLWDWYAKNTQYFNDGKDSSRGNNSQTVTFTIQDASWDKIDSSKNNKADAAIFVLARNGGEDADMHLPGSEEGDYLALHDCEKSVLKGLKALKDSGTISKIIILINSANHVSCSFIDNPEYGIDAVLWCGTLGTSGAEAVGNLLTGEANPSGKLSDTFWYEHSENPVMANFGVNEYENSEILPKIDTSSKRLGSANGANRNYVVYQEGIYNGYRYTETRYEDVVLGTANVGNYDYSKTVSYPFGYGLSYTEFEYSDMKVEQKIVDGEIVYEVSVKVKNVGDVAGKNVVQIYLQKPYTEYDKNYGVEKASVELVGFAKTELLKPDHSETVTVTVNQRDFASYDSYNAKTYVVGSEDNNDLYYLTVATDAHDAVNNILAAKGKNITDGMTANGNASMTYSTYIPFSDAKYATNKIIEAANANFKSDYEGQLPNYGVTKITNQFDNTDPNLFDPTHEMGEVTYTTRSDWEGTTGLHVVLTATEQILADMTYDTTIAQDDIAYPTYGASNNLMLINMRGLDYDDPLWDDLLDKLTWDETVALLSDGLRHTLAVDSIAKPATYEQNGPVGPVQKYGSGNTGSAFEGYALLYDDPEVGTYPSVYTCNGIVASTFNVELVEEFGEIHGEECLWAGYNGIYGLGLNIHRGYYNGRNFEYYSEDGYLTGIIAGYETKGIQSKGVYVITKHAVLNDQETCRHNGCTWSNEQAIREIYLKPFQLAIEYGNMQGVMTGLNRLGSKWTSEQGFCNTVLRAEFGLEGFIITDYVKADFMTLVRGLMGGTNLPDGTLTSASKNQLLNNLNLYSEDEGNYGELAWAMRESAHRILYTVANSNAMNYITSNTKIVTITPWWQTALSVGQTALTVLLIGNLAAYAVSLFRRRY